ncbi:MAG: hypothetical protein GX989_03770 [Firmicutes bacterium]|nr:hypothetical protein [Bacillota bacterium]
MDAKERRGSGWLPEGCILERRRARFANSETGLFMAIELELSGLPLWWDRENRELLFGPGKEALMPAVRWDFEMQEVLYRENTAGEEKLEEEVPGEKEPGILYYMYRNFCLPEHLMLFRKNGIRYDITVLIPGSIGAEYIKTAGHYHPLKPGAACTYAEVYEVIYGRALYLIQRPHRLAEPRAGLEEIIIFDAAPGDKVLIPPDFGHVTINPGPDFLIMSNLVAAEFESVYTPLQEMGGAGYFGLVPTGEPEGRGAGAARAGRHEGGGQNGGEHEGSVQAAGGRADDKRVEAGQKANMWQTERPPATGSDGPIFVPNPRYASLPPLLRARPQEVPQFSLRRGFPQYHAFIENPAHFSFLTHPEDFAEDFQEYLQGVLLR